jgi:hypothetical protein
MRPSVVVRRFAMSVQIPPEGGTNQDNGHGGGTDLSVVPGSHRLASAPAPPYAAVAFPDGARGTAAPFGPWEGGARWQ